MPPRKKSQTLSYPAPTATLPLESADVVALVMQSAGLTLLRPAQHAALRAMQHTNAFAAPPGAPGKERWPVKTGEDKDQHKIGTVAVGDPSAPHVVVGAVPTTVEELRRIPRPADMAQVSHTYPAFQNARASPVELIVWQVHANVILLKREADGDYHMVLQGASGETMIAESPYPAPPFISATNPRRAALKAVRDRIDTHFVVALATGGPLVMLDGYIVPEASATSDSRQALDVAPITMDQSMLYNPAVPFKLALTPRAVIVRGVGFFDRVHGQDGVSMFNGIELHPVLDLTLV